MNWIANNWQAILPWLLFVVLYIATFKLAWRKLADLIVSNTTRRHGVVSLKFWWELIYYRMILLLPYIPFIIFRRNVPTTLTKLIYWWVVLMSAMGILRFFGSARVVRILWWIYGYMYDGLNNFYPYRKLVQDVVMRLELSSGISLLEVGCGTGNVIVAAITNADISVFGIDSSKSMLRQAKNKLNKHLENGKVTLVYSDALQAMKKMPSDSFDRISMVNFLYTVPDRADVWRECLRLVKPDGLVVTTTSTDTGSKPIIQEHLRNASWLQLISLRLVGVVIVDYFISELAKTGPFNFPSQEILLKEVEEAGGVFSEVARVYGGPEEGVNIIFTVQQKK